MALPDLITLVRGMAHLRAVDQDGDDVSFKIEQASAIVWDYLKLSEVPEAWIENTSPMTYDIPRNVQTATLLVLSEIYENREASNSNPLSDGVTALLERLRDPAIA